jgi:hypothetical protein
MSNHKIKFKLGDAEFEAEGAEEAVQAQLERFLAALEARAAVAPPPKPATSANHPNGNAEAPATGEFDESLLPRIFELRQDGVVALRVLPKGSDKEGEALLLILLGFRRLKNEEHVLATQLLRASSYSGVGVYRPAHALAQYDRFLIRGGQRKGTTYSLNNQGIVKAQEIAMQIFA